MLQLCRHGPADSEVRDDRMEPWSVITYKCNFSYLDIQDDLYWRPSRNIVLTRFLEVGVVMGVAVAVTCNSIFYTFLSYGQTLSFYSTLLNLTAWIREGLL